MRFWAGLIQHWCFVSSVFLLPTKRNTVLPSLISYLRIYTIVLISHISFLWVYIRSLYFSVAWHKGNKSYSVYVNCVILYIGRTPSRTGACPRREAGGTSGNFFVRGLSCVCTVNSYRWKWQSESLEQTEPWILPYYGLP